MRLARWKSTSVSLIEKQNYRKQMRRRGDYFLDNHILSLLSHQSYRDLNELYNSVNRFY